LVKLPSSGKTSNINVKVFFCKEQDQKDSEEKGTNTATDRTGHLVYGNYTNIFQSACSIGLEKR
jgi:hypothetical protein